MALWASVPQVTIRVVVFVSSANNQREKYTPGQKFIEHIVLFHLVVQTVSLSNESSQLPACLCPKQNSCLIQNQMSLVVCLSLLSGCSTATSTLEINHSLPVSPKEPHSASQSPHQCSQSFHSTPFETVWIEQYS